MWNRQAAIDGLKALAPLAAPAPFFGLVFGFLVSESAVVSNLAGWSSSWIVFGGASQLAAVVLLEAGGSALLAVVTIVTINARHMIYSAALQPRFRDAPRWFRWVAPYVLVDQSFATSEVRPESDTMDYRVSFFLVTGIFWLVLWNVSVLVGIFVGNIVPESWSLDFAVPLLFLGLLINGLKNRPGILGAVISGAIAVAARDLQPTGLGLLLGTVCGMTIAALTEWLHEQRTSPEPSPS